MITRTTGRVSSAAAAMIAAVVLVASATAPAYAAVDPTTEAPKAPAKAEKADRYCVVETPTGSHRRQKVCRTRAEWIARSGVDPAGEPRK
ncbi:hypothetical protein E5A73_00305 [Sphingomonas gei]|uniref:Uncharacterized protein n=1 Tax=Sphingomonas gei TaxID=1395960 RepID=A0A4S1XG85_9SPHN|nr:hypothetical protein [Sphingomonas gei]TGX55619.1 hypothetical protein E5A73_00305 [Sphingomonas gei]